MTISNSNYIFIGALLAFLAAIFCLTNDDTGPLGNFFIICFILLIIIGIILAIIEKTKHKKHKTTTTIYRRNSNLTYLA